jgi:ADP-ribose pyrophosphatase
MPTDTPQTLYAGRFLELVRSGHWEYARRRGCLHAVGVIAITPDHRLLLVEQYRIPVGARTIELPAGLIGDAAHLAGEAAETAGRRELLEETGYEADHWEYLFAGPSSAGLSDEQLHLLLATGLRQVGPGGGDDSEAITLHAIPLRELQPFLAAREREGALVDMKVRLAGYLATLRGL